MLDLTLLSYRFIYYSQSFFVFIVFNQYIQHIFIIILSVKITIDFNNVKHYI